jgi:uncharacterized membrane protein YqhA
MNKVKEPHWNYKSTLAKLNLWAIQVIIAISVLSFLKFAFFGDMADLKPSVLTFCLTLLALITTFLMLCHYQKQIEEFALEKESLVKEVRAEEERRKLEAKMLEPQEPESLSVLTGGDLPPQKGSTC